MQADIRQSTLVDPGEELRHAVEEGLAADEFNLGAVARRRNQMFAAAKADLEAPFAGR